MKIRLRITLPLVCIGLLLLHALYYMPFISDDALISLRYAHRLIQGHGLTWTEGHPVEGYSNLLWVLLVALPGALGADLVAAARVLGILCMSGVTVLAAAEYLSRDRTPSSTAGYSAGMLFFIGAAPTAVWAIGGLEQPLIAIALAAAISLYGIAAKSRFERKLPARVLSVILGLLCLTRPDGPVFSAAVVVSSCLIGILERIRWSRVCGFVFTAIAVPVLAVAGQLAFRLAYYGEWVPNTARVKLTLSTHHLSGGLDYVWKGFLALAPASFLALLFLAAGIRHSRNRPRSILLLTMLFLWLSYLSVIGGDIFPAFRHFVPVVVILSYALIDGTIFFRDKLSASSGKRNAFIGMVVLLIALTVCSQFINPQNRRAVTERWEWSGRSLALTLKEAFFEKKPVLAVTAAGCLPYWSELPCLDMLGLNDYYLPRHKPETSGTGYLGHELGNREYVLASAPDIIVFHVGAEPKFQLQDSVEFHRQYAGMNVRTAFDPEYTALVWFRINSRRVGIIREENRFTIPAWLLNAFSHTVAYVHRGRLVVGVSETEPAGVLLGDIPGDLELAAQGPSAEDVLCTTERVGSGLLVKVITNRAARLPVEAITITVKPDETPL